jgi:hypothetical protein
MKHSKLAAIAVALCAGSVAPAQERAVNPQVRKILDEVSEQRIQATIEKLVSFGTRNTMSPQDDPARGIGAARQWIFNEMKSYSPRLQVRLDKWRVKKHPPRIFKDVDLYNVVAVLPGKTMPERQIWIAGHYDSLNLGNVRLGPPSTNGGGAAAAEAAWEANTALPAPGACDDGSGTAAVMELARVMSRYAFDKTLVFVTFAGEEQGLVGATLEAAKAKNDAQAIEAVLNNDIIGSEVAGNGRLDNTSVSVYSDDVMDSPSQELGRFAREVGERYLPGMGVNAIFMQDRLGRGGDHIAFQQEGFAAVRFSSPSENYEHQHSATDVLANMSVPYTARVAKINAAVAATLAMAPATPDIYGPAPRRLPMISRGQSRYDARLQWHTAGSEANLRGFSIVIRPINAPWWTREIFVGNVSAYTLKNISIDEFRFGVKAIGVDGTESLVAPYVFPPRAKFEVQTVQ